MLGHLILRKKCRICATLLLLFVAVLSGILRTCVCVQRFCACSGVLLLRGCCIALTIRGKMDSDGVISNEIIGVV